MKSPTLLALVVAEIVSSLGSAMTFLALPWFVLQTTGSPSKMSVVLAAELLPMALFGIPSGSVTFVVDNINRGTLPLDSGGHAVVPVSGLAVGSGSVDLKLQRYTRSVGVAVARNEGGVIVRIDV